MHIDFEKLFLQYFEDLCAYAYSFVADIDTSKDIVQEVFYSLWVNKKKYIISKSFLYACVKNESLDYLKSSHNQRKKSSLDSLVISLLEEYEDNIDVKDLNSEIDKCVNALPSRCQEIFILRREKGLKNKEIAEMLGISVKTVEVQIHKAILEIRKHLKHEGYLYTVLLLAGLEYLQS